MRGMRRRIMVVAAVLSVAVAAGPTLARSLPFADRSQPPTTRNATQAAATGAGAVAGALNRLPVKGQAAMTGYTRTQFGQAWTDDTDRELTRPWGHNGCDTRNDALARDLVEAHLKPGSRPLHRGHTRLAARPTHLNDSPNRPCSRPRERLGHRGPTPPGTDTARSCERPTEPGGRRRACQRS